MKLLDVIKYEGNDDILVWKHPAEDFNTKSQLIVHESQEAIFFKDGQALDLFGPGRYTLETKNIPLLSKIINIPTGGVTPFHCEVYFINKSVPLDLKWGTNSKFQVFDPKFNILLHAGANGTMGVKIDETRKFLIKLVGTKNVFDRDTLIEYFRDLIITKVKSYLTKIMSEVSFITVNAHLDEISVAIKDTLQSDLSDFGVKLVTFFVSTVQLSETDYEKVQGALADASAMGISSQAEKGKMDTLGYSWADKEMAEISKKYAENTGKSNGVGAMISEVPIALAFGEMLKESTQGFIGKTFNEKKEFIICPQCNSKEGKNSKFCSQCGTKIRDNHCSNCNTIIKENQKFCSNCGSETGE